MAKHRIEKKKELTKKMYKYDFFSHELTALAVKAANADKLKDDLERQFDSIKQDFKGRITGAELEMKSYNSKIRDGYELRDFLCRVEKDWTEKTITFTDDDTGNVMETRKMTPAELQEQTEIFDQVVDEDEEETEEEEEEA